MIRDVRRAPMDEARILTMPLIVQWAYSIMALLSLIIISPRLFRAASSQIQVSDQGQPDNVYET